MTKALKKILLMTLPVIACSFILFGYASVTDDLDITGQATITPPDFDEVVITKIETNSSTVAYEDSYSVIPTNLHSTITGNNGQNVTYKITARNFSKTDSFVYVGASYDSNLFNTLNKLKITVSTDKDGANVLNNVVSSNYHEGTAIAPGEDFVFYVTYTLTENVSVGELMVNYSFKPIVYTVTYLNNNETYAVDHVTNNNVAYTVKSQGPQSSSLVFAGWINANAIVVTSIPAGNTNSYTLSASWENIYLIIFADVDGTVLYQEQFTDSSTSLSASGQATVDRILAELNAEAEKQYVSVSWSEYDIANATDDIMVKAVHTYKGVLNLVPVYEQPDDGIVDYYKVVAVDSLLALVEVPGVVGGVPVKEIERIANTEGENDWNNFAEDVNTIIVGEGVERLGWNSLAWTPNLTTVNLPSTINYIGKNAFSRNDFFGQDKKVLTINYNGTREQWKAIEKHSDWDNGLRKGSKILCSDGYFELEGVLTSWKAKSY